MIQPDAGHVPETLESWPRYGHWSTDLTDLHETFDRGSGKIIVLRVNKNGRKLEVTMPDHSAFQPSTKPKSRFRLIAAIMLILLVILLLVAYGVNAMKNRSPLGSVIIDRGLQTTFACLAE